MSGFEHGCNKPVSVFSRLTGAILQITFECSDGHVTKWSSSNSHSKTRSVIDEKKLLIAASVLFSGNHYAKMKFFCPILDLKCPTEKMFYDKDVISDEVSGYIIDLANVDKWEVQFKSPVMDSEGFCRCLDNLANNSSAANERGMGKIALWADHLCNHFWFCCKHCSGNVEELQPLWISFYIIHINENGDDASSQPPTDENGKTHWEFRVLSQSTTIILPKKIAFRDKAYHQGCNWPLLITIIILEGNLGEKTNVTYVFIKQIGKGLSAGMLHLFWRKSHSHIYWN
uniref:Uncharacterized protein n=1 Tax=Amphimedon queenslandica TaxID=400682 RepID=A0A1X7UAA8_AMPQE